MRPAIRAPRPTSPAAPPPAGGRGADVERGAASLPGTDARWVSADAVRQAIGAWAYARPSGSASPRATTAPDGATVRAAVAVASALCELAADPAWTRWTDSAVAEQGRSPTPTGRDDMRLDGDASTAAGASGRDVRRDVPALAERSGLDPRSVERALTLLERADAVRRSDASGGPRLTLDDGVLRPAPVLAALAWRDVRHRLTDSGASVAAPLAVLREVADDAGPSPEAAIGAPVRLSVRMLEERTGYGRSTVAEAIAQLAAARVVDVEARPGRTARFALRPTAFGIPESAEAGAQGPRRVERAASSGAGAPAGAGAAETPDARPDARVAPSAGAATRPLPSPPAVASASWAAARAPAVASARDAEPATRGAPGPHAAAVLLGTFAGTPIHGPPGTPLVVECDADGRWTCRVGPFLVLGPVGGGDGATG